ncbi:MAG: hypothetical protein RL632_1992 [Bacteroidota bacterium]|jgi:hypothetical protein
MKIVRVNSHYKLFGLGDEIGTVPILQTTLGDYQKSICERLGLEFVEMNDVQALKNLTTPYFYFEAQCVFTKEFLQAAIQHAKRDKFNTSFQFGLGITENSLTFSLPSEKVTQTRKMPFFFVSENASELNYVELHGEEFELLTPMPTQIVRTGHYSLNQNPVFAANIISPFHLLQANMGLNMNRCIGLQKLVPKSLRKSLAKPFGLFAILGLKSINKKGKNCRIHPSAIIEGCIIGDNVTIGANCVLRMSIIGSGSFIGDAAIVTYSVIGERNFVATGNQLSLCLSYPQVFTIHGPYQFTIFGRSSAVFATINCDIRLDQKTISIETDRGVLDSQQYLLGIAYGHEAKVGGSNIIAAGRFVPNRTVLNPPDFIHLKFPENEH